MTLPAPPLRSDGPDVFADRGDAFMGALPQFEIDMNAVGSQAAAAIVASAAAIAAANYRGDYSAGTAYVVGQSVSYAGDIWYSKTSNTGVTPAIGAAWHRVSAAIADPSGNAGKVLGTDGTVTLWTARLPAQGGNSGKFLTTNGTNESWASVFASPAFTGVPTAPTAALGTSSTQLATTAFVATATQGNTDAAIAYSIVF